MNGRDVVRLVLLSAPRRPIVTKHAHRTSGVPLRVNCSCATRKQLRGPLLSVKNASPCADLELATHRNQSRAGVLRYNADIGFGPTRHDRNVHGHSCSTQIRTGWADGWAVFRSIARKLLILWWAVRGSNPRPS